MNLFECHNIYSPFIIMANGDFPHNKQLLHLINNNPVVACDGALNKLYAHGFYDIKYVIGDFDSINKITTVNHTSYIKICEQSSNDLSKAFYLLLDNCITEIIILGAIGGRIDHTLANIFLLESFTKFIPNTIILTDDGILSVVREEVILPSFIGQQVSFFTPYDVNITCKQLKWQLINFKISNLYHTTLNQSTHNTLEIKVDNPVIVYRCFKQI